jgi:hypothetical protein
MAKQAETALPGQKSPCFRQRFCDVAGYLRFVQLRDVGGDHVLRDRVDVDPFQLEADPPVWKTE